MVSYRSAFKPNRTKSVQVSYFFVCILKSSINQEREGEEITLALASIKAPRSRSSLAASLQPFLAAMCNGVSPYLIEREAAAHEVIIDQYKNQNLWNKKKRGLQCSLLPTQLYRIQANLRDTWQYQHCHFQQKHEAACGTSAHSNPIQPKLSILKRRKNISFEVESKATNRNVDRKERIITTGLRSLRREGLSLRSFCKEMRSPERAQSWIVVGLADLTRCTPPPPTCRFILDDTKGVLLKIESF